MSLVLEILNELGSTTIKYKGVSTNLFGVPKLKKYNRNSVRGTFYKLSKSGMIKNRDGYIHVTEKGKNYIKNKKEPLRQFYFKFDKNAPKDLLVMFDVPESKKIERDWLRWHLKKFNYVMIQKSVWVGPSPLPRDFMDYIKSIELKDSLQTFKLAKDYQLLKKQK